MMCDTKKHLFVKSSPKTASIADRNREGVRTSFADLDPLAHKVAEILGRELQERLFDLRPSNSRCVELRMSRQGDVMSSKSSMLSPEQKKICDTAYLQALRLAESQGLVSSARSQRCACLHAKHLHHTNAAVRLPTSPDRLSLSRHSLRRGQKKLHVPASTTLRMAPRQALPLRPAQWQVVLAAQTDTEGDPAGSGRLAWAAAGCLCYWAGSCIRPP